MGMKLIIAGSRDLDKYRVFYEVVTDFGISIDYYEGDIDCREFTISEFITGGCPTGADQFPYLFSNFSDVEGLVHIKEYPADWKSHGKAAGPIRNRQMAEYGDALLLIWDGKSRGSSNMKKEMERLGKPIYEIIITK